MTHRLNTTEEQVKILQALLEKKPVWFIRGAGQKEELFVGTLPNFNMYFYLQKSASVLLTLDKPKFRATAVELGETWTTGLNCVRLRETEDGWVIFAAGPNIKFDLDALGRTETELPKKKAEELLPVVDVDRIYDRVLEKLRKRTKQLAAQGNNVGYRTAKRRAYSKAQYFDIVQGSEGRRYYALIRVADAVLESENALSADRLNSLSAYPKTWSALNKSQVIIQGIVFNVRR